MPKVCYTDMKQNRITTLKNMVWAFGIVICLLFIGVGMIFAMFHRYTPPEKTYDYSLYSTPETGQVDLSSEAVYPAARFIFSERLPTAVTAM